MRITELEIHDYGVFSGRRLSFDEGRFHVICGPNEAGKSTLLQLLREMLFGFERRCAYHDMADGAAKASLACVLADGTRLRLLREKKKTAGAKELSGAIDGGESLSPQRLAALLGHADRSLFETVFAFSLTELSEGQKALDQANVSERIFSIGAGGLARFSQVRRSLQATLDDLFKPRGQKQLLNAAWRDFAAAEKEFRQTQIFPRELAKRREELEAARKDHAAAKGALTAARAAQAGIEKYLRALDPWRKRCLAESELGELNALGEWPPPDRFSLDMIGRYNATAEALVEARQRYRAAKDEVAESRDDQAAAEAEVNPVVLAAADRIARLQHDLGRMRQLNENIPKLDAAVSTRAESLSGRVREMCHAWTVDDLESRLRFDDGVHAEFRAWRDESRELDAALMAAEKDLADREAEAERLRARLAALEAAAEEGTFEVLESLVERAKSYRDWAKEAAHLRRDAAARNSRISDLRSRLAAAVGLSPETPLVSLPVPSKAAVEEHVEAFRPLQAKADDAVRMVNHREETLRDAKETLAALESGETIPNRETLSADRRRRDALWRLIRRRFVEGEPVADDEIAGYLDTPGEPVADTYERRVAAADELADACFDHADAVSRREQAAEALRDAEAKLADARAAAARCERLFETAQEAWTALWRPCDFQPQSPKVMRVWLDDYALLSADCEETAGIERELEELGARMNGFEAELDAALGETAGSIDTRLDLAERRVRAAREAATERRAISEQIEALDKKTSRVKKEAAGASTRRESVEAESARRREQLGLPESWNLDTLCTMLDKIRGAVAENDSLRAEWRSLEVQCDARVAFEAEAKALCREAAPDLAEAVPVDAVEELADRCAKARMAKTSFDEATKRRDIAERRMAEEEAKCAAQEAVLAELRAAAGAADDEQFHAKAAHVRRRSELTALAEECSRTIREICYPENEADFLAALAAADPDSLPGEREDAAREVHRAEEEAERAHARVLGAQKRYEELNTREEAIRAAAEVEDRRAALYQALDTWAPLFLADKLMTGAVARFEREKQPELLRRTAEWFRAMTAGRYSDVRTRIDADDELVVIDQRSLEKAPNALSRGTREQLYLALRLSFVEHYCRRSEPLPLVFDDILVNFDDRRERETLAALAAELPETIQVLFLTCHEETRARAEEAWSGRCRAHTLP